MSGSSYQDLEYCFFASPYEIVEIVAGSHPYFEYLEDAARLVVSPITGAIDGNATQGVSRALDALEGSVYRMADGLRRGWAALWR